MKTTATKIISMILMNLLISISAYAITDALKVKISNGIYSDETVVRFLPNATINFDAAYDAWKQFSINPSVPALFTNIDAQSHLSINALPSLNKETQIELCISTNTSGAYTIQSFELGNFLPGVSIMLEDKMTGMIYRFRKGSTYTINLFANTIATANRFSLHFSPPTNIVYSNVTCYGLTDGALTVKKSGNTNWEYQLKDDAGNVIHNGNSITEETIINGLNVGVYYIETSSQYTASDTNSFAIIQPNMIIADYEVDSSGVVIVPFKSIKFDNLSSGASSYSWNFGDGSLPSNQFSPVHQYSAAGVYVVSLTAANNGCDVIYSNTITVHPFVTTNIASVSQGQNTLSVFQKDDKLVINAQTFPATQMIVTIFNSLGQKVYSISRENETNVSESVSLSVAGTYIVNVYANNNSVNKKMIYQSR